jgi:hypothetical protein
MIADNDYCAAKRAVRLEIGRLRRRIDRRLHALGREGRQAVSWRSWARRYPAYSLVAAAGIGLAASFLLRRGEWTQTLARQFVRRAVDRVLDVAVRELMKLWSRSSHANDPAGPNAASGGEHGGT